MHIGLKHSKISPIDITTLRSYKAGFAAGLAEDRGRISPWVVNDISRELEQRHFARDLVTRGTAAMRFSATDQRARHCAIHGCPRDKRPKTWVELRTERCRWRSLVAVAVLILTALWVWGVK